MFLESEDQKLRIAFLLFVLSLIWGSSFILIKLGLVVFPPDQLACLRVIFAFLALSIPAVKNLRSIPKGKLKHIVISGIVGIYMPAFLFALAETSLASSVSGVLNALTPLFTFILAVIFFRHKLKMMQLTGLLIGFIGSIGLSFINSSGGLGSINVYALLIVIATIGYAINSNMIKFYLSGISSLTITGVSLLFIAPLAIIYLLFTDFSIRLTYDGAGSALLYIGLLGVFGTAISLVIYNKMIQVTSAVKATSVTYLIPIVAVLWGLLDGEQLFLLHYAGMVLIIIGVYLVNRTPKDTINS